MNKRENYTILLEEINAIHSIKLEHSLSKRRICRQIYLFSMFQQQWILQSVEYNFHIQLLCFIDTN